MIPTGLVVFAAAGGVAAWVMRREQRRATNALIATLLNEAASEQSQVRLDRLDDLPAPVARYLRLAIGDAGAVRAVRLQQKGTVRPDIGKDRWFPFEAEHVAAPHAVGFVWNARVAIAPLLHLGVRDSYIEGRGAGEVTFLSAFPVASEPDTVEMNAGALHRFLAEAPWYPTALLPGPKLQWTPIDERRALARLTDRGTTVSLEFRFADTGEVAGIYTPGRWGKFGKAYEQRPWEGHFRKYVRHHGLYVPTEGEVGWYENQEWRMVWKGEIREMTVES